VIICEIIVHLLVIEQNNKRCEVQVLEQKHLSNPLCLEHIFLFRFFWDKSKVKTLCTETFFITPYQLDNIEIKIFITC